MLVTASALPLCLLIVVGLVVRRSWLRLVSAAAGALLLAIAGTIALFAP